MFHHRNILAHAPFGAADVPADGCFNTGTFWHGDFLAWGLFGTRNFRHRNISARGHFGTWTFWHSSTGAKMTVPKHPYCFARCQNVNGAINSSCWKFPVRKSPHVKIFPCWNVHLPKCPQCQMFSCGNVPVMKHPCRNDSCLSLRFRNGGKPISRSF